MRVSFFGRGQPLSPPSSCFESRFFVLAEWLRNHPTPRTLSSLWKTLNHSVVVCSVCAVAVTHDTHPERGGGVKGKFSRGNYRKHLEEFRVSGYIGCPARRPKALKAETFGNFQTEEQFWRLGLQKNLVRYAH